MVHHVGPRILQQNLIIVVGSFQVAVNAQRHRQVRFAAPFAKFRTEAYTVNAAASIHMLVCNTVHSGRVFIHFLHNRQAYSRHHTVATAVHSRTVYLLHIERSDVELCGRLAPSAAFFVDVTAYLVVLIFERAVYFTVFRVEGYAAQMARKSAYRTYNAAFTVNLYQLRGVRNIQITFFLIHGNALDMELSQCRDWNTVG